MCQVRGAASALACVVLALLVACSPPTRSEVAQQGTTFGTLVSVAEHSADEVRSGVPVAMVELAWQRFEPSNGRIDEDYLRSVRAQIEALRSTGRTITLGLGLHDAPQWLLDIPDSRMVDDAGNVSLEPNLIFNQRLRDFAKRYLAGIAARLDLSQVDAIRVTSGGLAEVLYPGGDRYWAFDPNAQNGPDMPPSMSPNPAPGWRPGHGGLNVGQVRQWADWYVSALNDVVNWQVTTLSTLGFRGSYEVLTPGVGVLPKQYDAAVRQGLPPGLLGSGVAWQVFYSRLPRRPDVVAYVSSVADNSGGNGNCEPGDGTVALDLPDVEGWSSARWIARLAKEYGYAVSGENPGWRQSALLDVSYRDLSDSGMMAVAVRQARSCKFRTLYWAHDQQLWDGTVPFTAYAERIARAG